MTFPASPTLESAPYGPQPVLPVLGPQGGPYNVRAPLRTTVLPAVSRTASIQTADQVNSGYSGAYIIFGVSANPGGAQTLRLVFRAKDIIGATYFNLLDVAATVSPGGLFLLAPGVGATAIDSVTVCRPFPLPDIWAVFVIHSGVGAWTYYVDVVLLP
jgi:hypothetical protein